MYDDGCDDDNDKMIWPVIIVRLRIKRWMMIGFFFDK